MGAQNSQQEQSNPSSASKIGSAVKGINENYLVWVSQKNDDRYGDIKVYKQNNTEDLVALKQKIFNTEEQFKQQLETAKNYKSFNHPGIIQIVDLLTDHQDEFCSEFFNLNIYFEYFSNDLLQLIKDKQAENGRFDEKHLIYLFDTLLQALVFLNVRGMHHLALTPHNIMVTREGLVKISDVRYMTGQTNYKQLLIGLDCDCFLSPELFTFLKSKCLQPQADPEKCDVFSLGLVGLHMLMLSENLNVYNFDDYTLNWEKIYAAIEECQQQYSKEILDLVKGMIEPSVDKRFNLQQALEALNQLPEYAGYLEQQMQKQSVQQSPAQGSQQEEPDEFKADQTKPEVQEKVKRAGRANDNNEAVEEGQQPEKPEEIMEIQAEVSPSQQGLLQQLKQEQEEAGQKEPQTTYETPQQSRTAMQALKELDNNGQKTPYQDDNYYNQSAQLKPVIIKTELSAQQLDQQQGVKENDKANKDQSSRVKTEPQQNPNLALTPLRKFRENLLRDQIYVPLNMNLLNSEQNYQSNAFDQYKRNTLDVSRLQQQQSESQKGGGIILGQQEKPSDRRYNTEQLQYTQQLDQEQIPTNQFQQCFQQTKSQQTKQGQQPQQSNKNKAKQIQVSPKVAVGAQKKKK